MNATRAYSLGILAGGQGRRWHGRDKGLIAFNGKPLLAGVCAATPAAGAASAAAGDSDPRSASLDNPERTALSSLSLVARSLARLSARMTASLVAAGIWVSTH